MIALTQSSPPSGHPERLALGREEPVLSEREESVLSKRRKSLYCASQSVPKSFQQNLLGERHRDASASQTRRQHDATFVDEPPAKGEKSWQVSLDSVNEFLALEASF